MAAGSVGYTWNDKEAMGAIARLGGVLKTAVPRTIGVALVKTTQHRFDIGRDPFGARWKGLNPAS